MAVDDFETPRSSRRRLPSFTVSPETFGRGAEAFARFMGTPAFLVGMTVFCTVWLLWNTLLPEAWQFDPRSLNFTLLTLILSLQASYAAPLILLAENRSTDRDRVELKDLLRELAGEEAESKRAAAEAGGPLQDGGGEGDGAESDDVGLKARKQ